MREGVIRAAFALSKVNAISPGGAAFAANFADD